MGRYGGKVFNSQNQFDIESYGQVPREMFNINVAWLATLHKYIIVFNDAKFVSDFEVMYEAIESIMMLLRPKMNDEVKAYYKQWRNWLMDNKESWCVRNTQGSITRVHPQNRKILKKAFVEVMEQLIEFMEKVGILTKEKRDPRNILGNITG